jgi:hypothetical protein
MNPFLAFLFGKLSSDKKPKGVDAQRRKNNHEIARAQREIKARVKQFFKNLLRLK